MCYSLPDLTVETTGISPDMSSRESAVRYETNDIAAAAIKLLHARSQKMVTAAEWNELARAVKTSTGKHVEWRTNDEIAE